MKIFVSCGRCGRSGAEGLACCGETWLWDSLTESSMTRSDCQRSVGDRECWEFGHCQHYRSQAGCCVCGRGGRSNKERKPRRVWTDANGVVHKVY